MLFVSSKSRNKDEVRPTRDVLGEMPLGKIDEESEGGQERCPKSSGLWKKERWMCKEAMKCQQGGLRTVSIREHPVCQDNSQTMCYTLIYSKYPELLSLWVKKVDEGFPGAEALGKWRTTTESVGLSLGENEMFKT